LRKLIAGGVDAEIARSVVDDLATDALQSDARYADVFARSRSRRGQGPLRVRQELRLRGIDGGEIDEALAEQDWNEALAQAHARKFGSSKPGTPKEYAARVRFLQQRGFGLDAIRSLLRRLGSDEDFSRTDD